MVPMLAQADEWVQGGEIVEKNDQEKTQAASSMHHL